MIDFANTYDGKELMIPVYVDDEGTPATDVVMIEDGIMRNFMSSRETAARLGIKASMGSIGFLFELSKGPFLVETDKDGFYYVLHWGTRLDAFHMAVDDPKNKMNRALEDANAMGAASCDRLPQKTADGRRGLPEGIRGCWK